MYPLLMGYSVAIFPFARLKIDLNIQKSSIQLNLSHAYFLVFQGVRCILHNSSLDTPIIYIIISKNIIWIVDYSLSL